ncbi:MAG TPA: hypothetical protein PKC98_16675, partial [Candidatus Melainabacteria bacterium]|nr:hypothetical protein [Candidatus Melainabacteria bacterium]
RHFFYCLDGRVALSEGRELLDQLELHARRHYGQNWRWDYPDVERAIKLWDKNEYQGNYFYIDRFNLYPQSEKASFVLKILPEGASDDIKKLRSGNSEFHRFLETKSPQSDLLPFYVSPDSFLEFQKARDIAKKKGFHVALTVLAEEEIEFIFVNYRSSGDIPPQ